MKNPYSNLPIPFKYVLAATVLFSVLTILEDYTGYLVNQFEFQYSWFTVSVKAITTYAVWLLFSPFVAKEASKLQSLKAPKGKALILKIILVSIFIALCHRFLYQRGFDLAYYFKSGFLANAFSEKSIQLLGMAWITSIIQYWVILLLFFAITYYRAYLTKQKELNKAQLQALRMQLHPHFLFNTLHSISSLIDIDQKAAQKMIAQLGGLMRSTLEQDEKNEVTLKEEIGYAKSYLEIEHVRFQDRLEIKYEIEKEAENAIVPFLILQPIIENAIKHGIRDLQEDGRILVTVKKLVNNRLQIEIIDNGVGEMNKKEGTGTGMKNVKNRLKGFYDNDFQLESKSIAPCGYKVKIEIPFVLN